MARFADDRSCSDPSKKAVLCIVGPTSSGKSELAQRVAERLPGEVVSADSMQIYRGMDIGTGKVMRSERRVAHHCLDLIDPGEPFSAQVFQEKARACFSEIGSRNLVPVLCGGTGFYVRAAIDDYQFPEGEQTENPVRDRYTRLLESEGPQAVWDALCEVDHESAAVIHPNNSKRVIRALEMHELGVSYADQVKRLQQIKQVWPACLVGLRVDRAILYERINVRVDKMLESGLVDEVKLLLENGYREGITAQQAIGYKEIVDALDGKCSLEESIEQIKQSTRRYAKRQMSWFNRDSRITWMDATDECFDLLASRACSLYAEYTGNDAFQEQ